MPELEKLIPLCEGYLGLIFCNDHLSEIKTLLKGFMCNKGAKIGAISPCEVNIEAGPTGLDPKQTAFFQALNIQTKIVKTQIEIMSKTKILNKGQKIGASECALLDKLGIRPFLFEVEPKMVYDNGVVYSHNVLDIKKEEIIEKLRKGALYLTSASLAAGYPTALSAKQSVMTGFKNLLACTMGINYEFPEAKALKAAASKAPEEKPKEKKGEKKKEVEKAPEVEVKKEEKKEEPEIAGFGDIFGGD